NCALSKLEVYNVTYNDCTAYPWTICRCADAQLSVDQMRNAIGRVPPGARSNVVHYFVVSGDKPDGTISTSAGSSNDRVLLRGSLHDAVFMHETMHSVDKFSSKQPFTDAYNADSCVPDAYSNASPAEDFAQL
ncbi:uncharacterized protein BDR25DRAFT_162608, partial [Lindgomyces ingoldianus]